jgi:hypothetical protein
MAKLMSGLAAIFTEEHLILEAARKSRDLGMTKFEAISPYPVHGMEEACGIKRSPIPYVTFVAGSTGLLSALALVWYTSVYDWPINVGGKPPFSLPAFIPIMFELTVLFAALCSVGALFYFTNMPKVDPPTIDPDLTSHKFAIFVPENETGFEMKKLETFYKSLGAESVKKVEAY